MEDTPIPTLAAGVSFDGRAYRYGEYRYDRLADVAYSELDRARGAAAATAAPLADASSLIDLTDWDADAATRLGVSFDGKVFRYLEYRYDRFADACAYAELDRLRIDGLNQDEEFLLG